MIASKSPTIEMIAMSLRMLARKHEVCRSNNRAEDLLWSRNIFHARRDVRISMARMEKVTAEAVTRASEGMHAIMHIHLKKPQEFHDQVTKPLAAVIDELVKGGSDSIQVATKVLEMFGLDAKTAAETVT